MCAMAFFFLFFHDTKRRKSAIGKDEQNPKILTFYRTETSKVKCNKYKCISRMCCAWYGTWMVFWLNRGFSVDISNKASHTYCASSVIEFSSNLHLI